MTTTVRVDFEKVSNTSEGKMCQIEVPGRGYLPLQFNIKVKANIRSDIFDCKSDVALRMQL